MDGEKARREEEILRGAGLRATPQRLAILRFLKGTKAHPSPEMVYRELKPQFPGLSLNTVYQTLHALESVGLLRRISMEENVYRFDADVSPHVHLICRRCGKVEDCDGDLNPWLMDLEKAVAARSRWEILAEDACFYGYCPVCRRESGTDSGRGAPGSC